MTDDPPDTRPDTTVHRRDWPRLCGLRGYADLLIARKEGGVDALGTMADLLGYGQTDAPKPRSTARTPPRATRSDPVEPKATVASTAREPVPFWQPVAREFLAPLEPSVPEGPRAQVHHTIPPKRRVAPALAAWNTLVPALRTAFTERRPGTAPDVATITQILGRGELLQRIPRLQRRRWGQDLLVILDRSERLMPFHDDQHHVVRRLRALFPRRRVQMAIMDGDVDDIDAFDHHGEPVPFKVPRPGTAVLALTDLGCLAPRPEPIRRHWRVFGDRLAHGGCRPTVLNPAPACLWAREGVGLAPWTVIPWVRDDGAPPMSRDQRRERADRLLRLLSPALRIERGLLREIRLLLGVQADAATEVDAWMHQDMVVRSYVAGVQDPEAANRRRAAFANKEDGDTRSVVIRTLQRWRAGLPPEIWLAELMCLDYATIAHLPAAMRDNDLPAAHQDALAIIDALAGSPDARSWYRYLHEAAPHTYYATTDPELRRALDRIFHLAFDGEAERPVPPPGFDPRVIPPAFAAPVILELREGADGLVVTQPTTDDAPRAGSLVCTLQSRIREVTVEPEPFFWRSGSAPTWASDWGTDRFGAWAAFTVTGADGAPVTQRLRWIRPGRFLMGSPDSEPERSDIEGPQHEVVFERGFWLFDTACSQALWQAVMGENPSWFRSPDRPVERVSWDDTQAFLKRIKDLVPGLGLTLPSEAHWEYACRAGTTTPFSFGATITPEQANYDGNFPYQDGPKGLDRGETVPVASLPPNLWGLYEMHGNVWEWCADHWHGSYVGAPQDGSAWLRPEASSGANRVIRGGSWIVLARYVRSAARGGRAPGGRLDFLGFRCARVQGTGAEPRSGAAEPGGVGPDGQAERPSAPAPEGGAAPFVLGTDRERVTLRRLTRPDWAHALGRDRFGLWADIAIDPDPKPLTDQRPVRQRLRWIPPGRFLMGSPEDEPGRDSDERPQHEVTLSDGFWLFDTPCTQALWQAVMAENPSRFRSPDRPVETVSWDDLQEFLIRINGLVPGLNLSLPSEAQWEYACRAGTQTALYTGPIEILGDRNAPALDPIAWYGGNSGQDFDLADGENTTNWRDKQTDHVMAGTRRVTLKRPNDWGLFDMLGNIWEWTREECEKTLTDILETEDGAVLTTEDGEAIEAEKGVRQYYMKGGAWVTRARYVRAAYRRPRSSDFRRNYLGFRCINGQE